MSFNLDTILAQIKSETLASTAASISCNIMHLAYGYSSVYAEILASEIAEARATLDFIEGEARKWEAA